MNAPHPPSRWNRAALGITGAFLLLFYAGGMAFLLRLQRDGIGSWRGVAATYLGLAGAATALLGLALPLVRSGRLRAAPPFRSRDYAGRVALVLTAGAVGGVVASRVRGDGASLTGAALVGAGQAAALLCVTWLFARLFRPAAGRAPAP